MNAPATTYVNVCVWIDHREAKIFGIGLDSADESLVRESGPHHHIHRKADHVGEGKALPDAAFLGAVAGAIAHAQALLLAGPGTAKTELAAYLKHRHPELARRIWGVEPMNHPTDPEVIQAARRFFRAAARLHG
jgi:stalled ribosome rescue protein Dom34